MKLQITTLTLFLSIILSCTNGNKQNKRNVQVNSPEYNERLKKAGVDAYKVCAIVESISEISPQDSILLLLVGYKNGVERLRYCYNYSSFVPDDDDYSYSSIGFHNVFEIPFDYKSLCHTSKYIFDSTGKLRLQADSINWRRFYEYDRRSGRMDSNVVNSQKGMISSNRIKHFNKKGYDSVIIYDDVYANGYVFFAKTFEWLNDSMYKIRFLPSTFHTQKTLEQFVDGIKKLEGELVEVGQRSTNSIIIYRETHTPPFNMFNKIYGPYSEAPTAIRKHYYSDPKTFIEIYSDTYFKSNGFYDSSILEFDRNDSLILKTNYHGGISNIYDNSINLKFVSSIKYNRNKNGLITMIREDNYQENYYSVTKIKYDIRQGKINREERIKETFDDKGKIYNTEKLLFEYDNAGNILQEKRITTLNNGNDGNKIFQSKYTYSFDSMGNRISEKVYYDEVLNISKEWKFDKNGLITEYLISDKAKGKNNKLVWVYKYLNK